MKTLTRAQARKIASDHERLAGIIGWPFPRWSHQCHAVSTQLLRSGEFGPGRIARGTCYRVTGQHSWIVLGDDCYDPDAVIVDPTLWSYNPDVEGIAVPLGQRALQSAGMPCTYGGEFIELAPGERLSADAEAFLEMLGPLDRQGWAEVAHLPVQDWPAAEILAAMCDTPGLGVLIPIDIRGMVADREPGYRWPDPPALEEARP